MSTKWEAFAGVEMVRAGKLADGRTRNTLIAHIIVAFSKTDVRHLQRGDPHLRFHEVTEHEAALEDAKPTVRAVRTKQRKART